MSKGNDQTNPCDSAGYTNHGNPFFSRADVLQTPNRELYEHMQNYATQFAILGYTTTASSIIGKLNNHNWYNDRSQMLRPLYILWNQIEHWPDRELDRVREFIQAERKRNAEKKVKDENGEYTGKKVKLEVDESPITMEDVEKHVDDAYHSWAICWWYPGRPNNWSAVKVDTPPSPHEQNKDFSTEELKKMLHVLVDAVRNPDQYKGPTTGKEPVDSSGALVNALEVRIMLREKDVSDDDVEISEDEILKMIAEQLNGKGANHMVGKLSQSRRAWPLLRDGALVKILNIDKNKLDLFATDLESAITERLEIGKQPPPSLSIHDIVEAINKNTLTNPGSLAFIAERGTGTPRTILHPPAPASLIEETEKRLETQLPNDYKEYLAITNGNEAMWSGIIDEPPLRKCEDIRWFNDDEDYFSEMTVDIPADMSGIMHEIDDSIDWPQLGNCLIIGDQDVDFTFLVPPTTVKTCQERVAEILESEDENVTEEIKNSVKLMICDFAGSMQEWEELEWCIVKWEDGFGEVWKSFKAYMRGMAEQGREKEKGLWNLEYGEFFGKLLVREETKTTES